MNFVSPIGYLERSDFTTAGDLTSNLSRQPIFIMIYSDGCPHCVTAKPAFQALANDGIISCMAIQLDGQRESERELKSIIKSIYPSFGGYPSYLLIFEGRKYPYTGDRSYDKMKEFISSYL